MNQNNRGSGWSLNWYKATAYAAISVSMALNVLSITGDVSADTASFSIQVAILIIIFLVLMASVE